jgi:arylformamidase
VTSPWHVSQLNIGAHLGMHIDVASHFIPYGKTISEYPPDRFLLKPYQLIEEGDFAFNKSYFTNVVE